MCFQQGKAQQQQPLKQIWWQTKQLKQLGEIWYKESSDPRGKGEKNTYQWWKLARNLKCETYEEKERMKQLSWKKEEKGFE